MYTTPAQGVRPRWLSRTPGERQRHRCCFARARGRIPHHHAQVEVCSAQAWRCGGRGVSTARGIAGGCHSSRRQRVRGRRSSDYAAVPEPRKPVCIKVCPLALLEPMSPRQLRRDAPRQAIDAPPRRCSYIPTTMGRRAVQCPTLVVYISSVRVTPLSSPVRLDWPPVPGPQQPSSPRTLDHQFIAARQCSPPVSSHLRTETKGRPHGPPAMGSVIASLRPRSF